METNINTLVRSAERTNGYPPRSQHPLDPVRPLLRGLSRYWWVELAVGILWTVIAVVILKFNAASVVTVGVLTGCMVLMFAAEQFVFAFLDRGLRWLWGAGGVLLTIGGIAALAHPVSTFAGLADILGFVFLLIGVQWMVRAFIERGLTDLWWLTLISGVLMIGLAFWVSGEFFLDRAYTLLVFSGIWAAMKGITDIVRGFELRHLGS